MEITREHKEEDKEEEAYPHSSSASTHTAPSNGPEYNAFASKLMVKRHTIVGILKSLG
jgi:hypothetical protein